MGNDIILAKRSPFPHFLDHPLRIEVELFTGTFGLRQGIEMAGEGKAEGWRRVRVWERWGL